MRKVIFGGANSLDNFIARADDSFDWILHGDEAMELMKEMWPRFDTMVMGRKTYDVTRQFAPRSKSKKPKNEFNMAAYVFSRTEKPGARDGVEFVSDHPGRFVRKLKKQKGKDIMVFGGGEIGSQLLAAGVVDEIGFNIQPVLLGSGIPLFHPMKKQIDLELKECRPFKNGCVYLSYRVKNRR